MSKRSRRRHRHTKRNPLYAIVKNGRRVVRNVAASDVFGKVVLPTLAGTGGLLGAWWLAQNVAPKFFAGQDPRLLQLGSSVLGGVGTLWLGENMSWSPETTGAVVVGMGIASAMTYLPSAMNVGQPLPPVATSGMHGGLMVDVSHAGAPYKGMLGLGSDPADQSAIDDVVDSAESYSIVEPTDMAVKAQTVQQWPRVTEEFTGSPGDKGYAGGVFARNLFAGMMGA